MLRNKNILIPDFFDHRDGNQTKIGSNLQEGMHTLGAKVDEVEFYQSLDSMVCLKLFDWVGVRVRTVKDLQNTKCKPGYHQKGYKQQMLARMCRKGNPCTLLVGM